MSLKKNDLYFFQKLFPQMDFSDAYWAFSCWRGDGRNDNIMCPGLDAEILYGVSFKSGGGLAEMSMQWDLCKRDTVTLMPYLRTFMDATVLLASPMHQKLSVALMKYKESGPTPEQFSKLLVSLGFEDNSIQPPEDQGGAR